jgi:hypothetical protein
MTDSTALTKRADSHARRGTVPIVPAKVKAAVEILLTLAGAPDYAAIAATVGYRDAHELRKQLMKPVSVRHMRVRKQEVLAQINLHNPERLRRVADESENAMARVQAVRALEAMGERMGETSGSRHGQVTPGFVIVIKQPDPPVTPPSNAVVYVDSRRPTIPAGPVIDAEPGEFRDVDSVDR